MMMLDDVITRLDMMREDCEQEAQAISHAVHQLNAEALGAALSLLRGYRLANERTECPAQEIMWVTPEQVRELRGLLGEARYTALIAKDGATRIASEQGMDQKAALVVKALTRAEILMLEVESHVSKAD